LHGALVRLVALVVWRTLAWSCVSGSAGTPTGTYTITFTAQQRNIVVPPGSPWSSA